MRSSGRQGVIEPVTGFDNLGDIHSGDLNQGKGVSTSQLQRVTVSPFQGDRDVRADAEDAAGRSTLGNIAAHAMSKTRSGAGSSLGVWAVLFVLLVLVKIVTEKAGEASEFATVRIGLENWFVVGALALTFGYVFKVGAALLPSTGRAAMAIREFAGAS